MQDVLQVSKGHTGTKRSETSDWSRTFSQSMTVDMAVSVNVRYDDAKLGRVGRQVGWRKINSGSILIRFRLIAGTHGCRNRRRLGFETSGWTRRTGRCIGKRASGISSNSGSRWMTSRYSGRSCWPGSASVCGIRAERQRTESNPSASIRISQRTGWNLKTPANTCDGLNIAAMTMYRNYVTKELKEFNEKTLHIFYRFALYWHRNAADFSTARQVVQQRFHQ